MCGKVRHAIAAVEAGCDIVVAQGTEAGGHTGLVATMPLVPQIVDAVGDRVPVVAAGGIFDGRGLAAALALGADGVWVGTRFIATPEARAVARLQGRAARPSAEDGTVDQPRRTRARRAGSCATPTPQYFDEHPDELQPFPAQIGRSMHDGAFHLGGDEATAASIRTRSASRPDRASARSTRSIPAGDLVRQFVAEAEAALARAGSLTRTP